jgi:hypothetical protein
MTSGLLTVRHDIGLFEKSLCYKNTSNFVVFKKKKQKHFWILSRQKKKTNQNANHFRI